MPPSSHEPIIGLPDYKIISYQGTRTVEITAEYTGDIGCINCGSVNLRKKERFNRVLKHHSIGLSKSILLVQTYKFQCRDCGRYFNQRRFSKLAFPGRAVSNCNPVSHFWATLKASLLMGLTLPMPSGVLV